MIPKGTMRPLKKVMGVVVGLAGVGFILGIEAINNITLGNQMVFGILLAVISYFLLKSGAQL